MEGYGKRITIRRREAGLIHLRGVLPSNGLVHVAIVVPLPSQSPRDKAAGPPGGLQKPYEVVVRKSGKEGERVTLQTGDILRLDEEEEIEATGGGIAFIVLKYDVVLESQDP